MAFGNSDVIHTPYNFQLCVCLIKAFISDYSAECDKLRKDGFRSSQYYSQGPTFSDPAQSISCLQDDEDDDMDKKVHRTTIYRGYREFSVTKHRLNTMASHSTSIPPSGHM